MLARFANAAPPRCAATRAFCGRGNCCTTPVSCAARPVRRPATRGRGRCRKRGGARADGSPRRCTVVGRRPSNDVCAPRLCALFSRRGACAALARPPANAPRVLRCQRTIPTTAAGSLVPPTNTPLGLLWCGWAWGFAGGGVRVETEWWTCRSPPARRRRGGTLPRRSGWTAAT